MSKQRYGWPVVTLSLILMITLGCASLGASATPTSSASGALGSGGGAGAASGAGSGNPGGGNPGAGSGGGIGPGGSGSSSASPEPPGGAGPWAVKQTHSLGGETISGFVCSLTRPFIVNVKAPKVGFVFSFAPKDQWAYAYSIPKAGESHTASGNYTIGAPDQQGSLVLTMTGKDHVVFKGFDGNMPVYYSFKLVPAANSGCP